MRAASAKAKPSWIKATVPSGENYFRLKNLVREMGLHTVCEQAKCPNIGECWGAGTLTFMIMGDTCTRSCGFCHVKTGRGGALDWDEPRRIAQAVRDLRAHDLSISHIVITSVNRDDKNLESATIFARAIKETRRANPSVKIECLIPDFKGSSEALSAVLAEKPDVLNHNIETVPRLYSLPQKTPSGRLRAVRPQAVYERSLELLETASRERTGGMLTKSGMMVGLGETFDEIAGVLKDLRAVGCDIITIGQYLRPTNDHIAVSRFYHPLEFEALKNYGEKIVGIPHIEAGPLVRSSYHAQKQTLKLGPKKPAARRTAEIELRI